MSQTGSVAGQRKHLHFDALIEQTRRQFEKIPDQRRSPSFSLADTLMAGLALFSLKDPSLLAFCRRPVDHNLRSVFGLKAVPSDTQMREILDEVDPNSLRPAFNDIFRQVQRGKVLEDYVYLNGHYLIACDGVEHFCSKKVNCKHCMTRRHSNGEVSYYHQMLGVVLIHPDFREVFPLFPEPILRSDGNTKNDCERNAAGRWLIDFRIWHPYLRVIYVEDGLGSNAPHIRDLKAANVRFILVAKPGDHKYLFEQVAARAEAGQVDTFETVDAATGTRRRYLICRNVSINESNKDIKVNFLKYVEIDANGECHEWTWVTDLELNRETAPQVMRAGRARWKIENETFNTLKNQGYHFEHNYGHGENNLCTVFALLMMLAFLIDQVQQRCNPLFRAAWAKKGPKCALWEEMRSLFSSFTVTSMRMIYEAIAFGYERPPLKTLGKQASAGGTVADTS